MTIQISRHTIIGAPSMRITRPKSAAFSPLDLSPVLWLDFSDASTLYQDSAKTTPTASDGDVIGAAEDKSGNGNDATQGTTANKPLYKTGIQNGRSAGLWDGVDDYLQAASNSVLDFTTESLSGLVVWKASGVTDDYAFSKFPAAGYRFTSLAGPERLRFQASDGAAETKAENATVSVFHLAAFILDRDNDLAYLYRNGTELGSAADFSGLTGSITNTNTFTVGQNSANLGSTTNDLDGYMCEILLFPTALSTADRQSLETYLNDKWSIY